MTDDRLHSNSEDISDGGERVSHLVQDASYVSHLSIYEYAARYARGATILDAGCGAGYGSCLLADHGATHVWAIDASQKAIDFCRHHFIRPNLTFRQMDLGLVTGFDARSFDFVFSSQALEHVQNIHGFMRAARSILKPEGALFNAVPTITDDRFLYLNVTNPYHLNIWSPRQWEFVTRLYFDQVEVLLHGVGRIGRTFRREHFSGELPLRVDDFVFRRGTIDEIYKTFSLNTILLARSPKAEWETPRQDARLPYIDGSFSRSDGYIDPALRERLKFYFDMPDQIRLLTETRDPGKKRFPDLRSIPAKWLHH
jgi:SAM-dependent methyltransferase